MWEQELGSTVEIVLHSEQPDKGYTIYWGLGTMGHQQITYL